MNGRNINMFLFFWGRIIKCNSTNQIGVVCTHNFHSNTIARKKIKPIWMTNGPRTNFVVVCNPFMRD